MFCSKVTPRRKLSAYVELGLMIVLFTASPNYAQNRNFFLPVELGQGIIFTKGVDAYTGSAQFHPALGFGDEPKRLRIGGSLAITYINPEWTFLWGGRVSVHIVKLVRRGAHGEPHIRWGGIHLVGKALLQGDDFRRISGGVLFEVGDGIFQVSPQLGDDRTNGKKFLEVSLGTDMAVLFRLFQRAPDEE